ncbi:MAG: hypothetical protein HC921_12855 [Synechococcaceae cyanobacterium SM2_3_1]|nr:hypothetical protein [Synechococcaceae cyanobacterium SM2_3_1]
MRSTISAYFGSSVSSQIEEANLEIRLIRSGSPAQSATEWIQRLDYSIQPALTGC